MFEIEIEFSKLVKRIVFRCLPAKKRLTADSIAYALHNRQGKQAFVKENEKTNK